MNEKAQLSSNIYQQLPLSSTTYLTYYIGRNDVASNFGAGYQSSLVYDT
jgi:hypothetical protein